MTRCVDLEGARVHALVFVPVFCFKRTVLSGRHCGAQALFTSQGDYITGLWSRAVSPLLSAVCHSMALLLTPVSLLVEFSFSQETESPRTAEMDLACSPGAPAPGTEPITWNGCSRKHSRTEAWGLLWFLAIYLPRQLSSCSNTSAETFFHIFNTCMKFHLIVNYFKQHSIVLKVNKIKTFF